MNNNNLLKNNESQNSNKNVLFPYKGLNIALGVISAVAVIAIIGLSVWANI